MLYINDLRFDHARELSKISYTVGITVTWMLTGLWHGANYTFIVWGLIHGIFLIFNHATAKPRKRFLKHFNIRNDNIVLVTIDTLITFVIIMFTWIFFKADDVGHAVSYISGIFTGSILTMPHFPGMRSTLVTIIFIFVFLIVELIGRKKEYAIAQLGLKWYKPVRWTMYYAIILAIFYFADEEQKFIYFQF